MEREAKLRALVVYIHDQELIIPSNKLSVATDIYDDDGDSSTYLEIDCPICAEVHKLDWSNLPEVAYDCT